MLIQDLGFIEKVDNSHCIAGGAKAKAKVKRVPGGVEASGFAEGKGDINYAKTKTVATAYPLAKGGAASGAASNVKLKGFKPIIDADIAIDVKAFI
ncbi:hypothetical protein [Myxosarcina sp. GI1]|uniref:hypothetical protein n=1 Tax=Myxosarcina sp. GI1 TaxID=1541065 RepID=UPI0005695235|nr:hypothetical protein [Myxosarcina sp. GI1]